MPLRRKTVRDQVRIRIGMDQVAGGRDLWNAPSGPRCSCTDKVQLHRTGARRAEALSGRSRADPFCSRGGTVLQMSPHLQIIGPIFDLRPGQTTRQPRLEFGAAEFTRTHRRQVPGVLLAIDHLDAAFPAKADQRSQRDFRRRRCDPRTSIRRRTCARDRCHTGHRPVRRRSRSRSCGHARRRAIRNRRRPSPGRSRCRPGRLAWRTRRR